MTPRPRNRKNKGLPVNLYTANAGKSFQYKHPVTGKLFGMGPDKLKAITAAKQLNGILIVESDLTGHVLGYVTVSDHIDWMWKNIIPDREYSKPTKELREIRFRNLIKAWGSKAIGEITVQEVATLLEGNTPRVSNQIRQTAVDLFNTAMSRGLCHDNPAEVAIRRKQRKVRQRLTVEQFQAIRESAPYWLQNAMDIGLITLQRRQDICLMKFSDIKDGAIFLIQNKTQKYDSGYLKINISSSLAEVFSVCKDSIISPYIIHRRPDRKAKRPDMEHWTQVKPEMISRWFKKIRDNLDIFNDIPIPQRPTFHEIRALGIKLYKDAGANPQGLAGHASEEMTKNYDSGHDEIRWVNVEANLKIPSSV